MIPNAAPRCPCMPNFYVHAFGTKLDVEIKRKAASTAVASVAAASPAAAPSAFSYSCS